MLGFWDEQKYNRGGGPERDRADQKGSHQVDCAAVAKAVREPFLCYARVLGPCQDVLTAVQAWGESCSCHIRTRVDATQWFRSKLIARHFFAPRAL
eukprot:3508185-Alexandrium_andersonii.AAC.1